MLENKYIADVISTTDYYPFGSTLPGRSFNTPGYDYGHGGQLADDEITGNRSHYSAEYWEYDSRLGRRWNVDPITYPWQSSYATFNNNPIVFNDPTGLKGDDGWFKKKKSKDEDVAYEADILGEVVVNGKKRTWLGKKVRKAVKRIKGLRVVLKVLNEKINELGGALQNKLEKIEKYRNDRNNFTFGSDKPWIFFGHKMAMSVEEAYDHNRASWDQFTINVHYTQTSNNIKQKFKMGLEELHPDKTDAFYQITSSTISSFPTKEAVYRTKDATEVNVGVQLTVRLKHNLPQSDITGLGKLSYGPWGVYYNTSNRNLTFSWSFSSNGKKKRKIGGGFNLEETNFEKKETKQL